MDTVSKSNDVTLELAASLAKICAAWYDYNARKRKCYPNEAKTCL